VPHAASHAGWHVDGHQWHPLGHATVNRHLLRLFLLNLLLLLLLLGRLLVW
jgi:hypothetical protein